MFNHWIRMEAFRAMESRNFPIDHPHDQDNDADIAQQPEEKKSKFNIFNPYDAMNNLEFNDLKSIFFLYIISILITLIIFLIEFITSLSSFKRMINSFENYYFQISMKCK